MTSRVFDCPRPKLGVALPSHPIRAGARRGHGVTAAALTAAVLVPLVGAAERPNGWLAASVTALALLAIALIAPGRVRWGWLALLAALAGTVLPRGQLGFIGPILFVATAVCSVMWWANRGRRRWVNDAQPPGSAERQAQVRLGASGEREVGRVLARELPQDYALINGLALPRAAGDIDHLVVGPSGVFLLETKTMAGRIVCEADGTWRRTRVGRAGTAYPAYIGDPARQVQRNIFAVRECLRKRLPQLLQGTPLWIEGLVVFPHPRTELQAQHSRVPAVLLEEATARICSHTPRRRVRTEEVQAVVEVLLQEAGEYASRGSRLSAQAVVEVALMLPVVLGLVFGTVSVSRLVQAQTAVVAVAHEAARAGALAHTPPEAIDSMRNRSARVAPGLGLDPRAVILDWDVTRFDQDPGMVRAIVRYPVDFADIPLISGLPVTLVRAEHVEWVDPFRSGTTLVLEPTD